MKLYNLFADILEPPGLLLSDRVNQCISILASSLQEAAGLLNQFKTFLDQTPLSRKEEIYTGTFHVQTACYPYVGYHLFRDGSHRKLFLAGLEEQYQIYDFLAADELPDHLGIMLRFLAKDEDEEERDELISLWIIPALKRMLGGFEVETNPYKVLLRALLLVLQEGHEARDEKITVEMRVKRCLRR